jgi:hypothetical protein
MIEIGGTAIFIRKKPFKCYYTDSFSKANVENIIGICATKRFSFLFLL